MSASDTRILEAVCTLLQGEDLKARELAKRLSPLGITIEKSDLSSILYRFLKSSKRISVDSDGVWRLARSDQPVRSGLPAEGAAFSLPPSPSPDASLPPANSGAVTLTAEQCEIVEAPSNAWLLVEAGPGTGKTAVALARVAKLLDDGLAPRSVLMISFTRTAVAELRFRIARLAKDNASAAAVRITTLDSEAWNIGVGLGDDKASEKLAAGFDGNIAAAIALFKKADGALLEWLDSTRHVIIDEAQDLVGSRAELVFQLLDLVPRHSGFDRLTA